MNRWQKIRPWVLWLLVLVLVTLYLVSSKNNITQVHAALIYLLVILGGSISGGRALGLSLAFASIALLDYYFQPPYDEFTIGKNIDILALVAFLATAVAATQLLARAQSEAEEARRRADEVATLARIGSESLSAGRAEDALVAIAGVIGFVGLIVPHVTRLLWGGDYRRLLPLSAVLGAAFLVGSDTLGRTVLAPQEVCIIGWAGDR